MRPRLKVNTLRRKAGAASIAFVQQAIERRRPSQAA
jgi:hypothetical protein